MIIIIPWSALSCGNPILTEHRDLGAFDRSVAETALLGRLITFTILITVGLCSGIAALGRDCPAHTARRTPCLTKTWTGLGEGKQQSDKMRGVGAEPLLDRNLLPAAAAQSREPLPQKIN
jgi:hypothetical protein